MREFMLETGVAGKGWCYVYAGVKLKVAAQLCI